VLNRTSSSTAISSKAARPQCINARIAFSHQSQRLDTLNSSPRKFERSHWVSTSNESRSGSGAWNLSDPRETLQNCRRQRLHLYLGSYKRLTYGDTQVNVPKTRRTYCKGQGCKKHTQHKVTQYKAGKVSIGRHPLHWQYPLTSIF
jgi:hypothetical protein